MVELSVPIKDTQNLLMTLWPIGDEATVQIMSDFYQAAHNKWERS